MWDNDKHFDGQFTDHAWAEMAKLLDKEMPVAAQKRRKALAWWWFLTAVAVGAAALAGFYLFGGGQQIPKATPLQPVAVEGLKPQKAALPENLSSKQYKSSDPTPAGLPQQPTASRNTGPRSQGKLSTATIGAGWNDVLLGPNREAGKIPMASEISEGAASSPKVRVDEQVAGKNLELLSALDLPALAINYKPQNDAPTLKIEPQKRPLKYQMAVVAGGMLDVKTKGNGMFAGVLLSKPFKNNNYHFSTGLMYLFTQQPLAISINSAYQTSEVAANGVVEEVIEFDYMFDNETSKASVASDPDATIETNVLEPLRIHSLSIPVGIDRKLGTRWKLGAGAKLNVAMVVGGDFAKGGFFSTSRKANLSGEFLQNLDQNDQSELNVTVRTFDLELTGGLQFQLTPSFGLSAKYHQGMLDQLKNNSTKDKNHFVQLGIAYRLGK